MCSLLLKSCKLTRVCEKVIISLWKGQIKVTADWIEWEREDVKERQLERRRERERERLKLREIKECGENESDVQNRNPFLWNTDERSNRIGCTLCDCSRRRRRGERRSSDTDRGRIAFHLIQVAGMRRMRIDVSRLPVPWRQLCGRPVARYFGCPGQGICYKENWQGLAPTSCNEKEERREEKDPTVGPFSLYATLVQGLRTRANCAYKGPWKVATCARSSGGFSDARERKEPQYSRMTHAFQTGWPLSLG